MPAIVLAAIAVSPLPAAVLARGGTARATIVLAASTIPSEATAASELALYLEKITGAKFEVRSETGPVPAGPRIYVGPTRLARRLGLGPERLGREEWAVRASGDGIVLAGGRPRGTLYAVYHFLEDDLGVRWWNAFEESVPRQATLRVGEIAHGGKPAFGQRDLSGADGRAEFLVRNRVNGALARITWRFGGYEGFATPWFVHSFNYVVPPQTYFTSHPEYFSERDGARTAEKAQLCLSNPDLPALVAGTLTRHADEAEARSRESGIPAPRLVDFSQNDWGGWCKCSACEAEAESAGGQSGTLVTFLNDVAARVRRDHPEVLLTTLAYTYTFDPGTVRPADSIVVRLSGYGKRDFSRGIAAPENRRFREAVEAWSRMATHLWIWDYAVVFFENDRNLPIPSYRYYADDLRFYRDHGVSGILVQHEFPIASDLRDLKVWLYVKLMEDPDRDLARLIADFTEGYYGDAAGPIRRYLSFLESAADRKPGYIGAESEAPAFKHVDADFVVGAERIFDDAEAAVRKDPVRLRRVRHARLTVDYALLTLDRSADLSAAARRARAPVPDRSEAASRYRLTWNEQIDLRADAADREKLRATVDSEVAAFLSREPGQ